ncbi:50S ribosomal protein L3 [Candidatus Vidania fulgoroideorum]
MSNLDKKILLIKKNMFNVFYKSKFFPVTILKIKKNNSIKFKINKFYRILCKSKGKGFCGTIKKYGFSQNYNSHGNSKAHRKQGSIGMCQDPGRVIKGKKMPGRLGNNFSKIKNIKIFYFDKNKIFIKGSIPGFYNQIVKLL